jgi:hypothetical protein
MALHSYCLSKTEYLQIIFWELFSENIDGDFDMENLKLLIEDSSTYWDKKIIGLNYFLSILTEQLIKKDKFDIGVFEKIYNLKNKMYFEIEEFDYEFIQDLILNKEPVHTKELGKLLNMAIRDNNVQRIEELKEEISTALEDELIELWNHE